MFLFVECYQNPMYTTLADRGLIEIMGPGCQMIRYLNIRLEFHSIFSKEHLMAILRSVLTIYIVHDK